MTGTHLDEHTPTATTPRDALRAWLEALRRRWRRVASLEVFARAAIVAAIAVLSGWLVERLLQPSGGSLVALFTVVLGVIVIGCGLAYRRLRQPPSDLQLARLAEERQTDLDDVLVTATERLHAGKPGPLDGLVVRSAVNRVREVAPDTVIAPEQMRRAGLRAGLAALALGVAVVVGFRPAWRAWNTALLIVAPPTIALKVEPGDVRLARGTALKIRARLEGLPAGAVPDAPTIRMLGAGQSRALPMRADGAGYLFEVERINQPLRYQVRAGRLTSREYVATPVDPARVTRIDVDYTFPAFTKLTPRREEDGGDIYGPEGTQVRVWVHTDKPVVGGNLNRRGDDPVGLGGETQSPSTVVAGTFTLARDSAYRVSLRDIDGFASTGDTEYFIRLMDDRPPDVRVLRPAGDRQVTRLEEIVIEARADDDHGIERLDLVYAVRGGKERTVSLNRASRSTSVTGAHTLYVEDLDVQPGDFITYYARARDVSRAKPSTEARSDIFFLEVRPFQEEFFAAQSQSMMAGGGGMAADLLEAQKEIIVATWKLQRRAVAGQSAEDVRAIARAQGELKARAEKSASMFGPPPTGRRRSQAPREPAVDTEAPMRKVVNAMGMAEAALNRLKPPEAIPHEMTAYNELLRLQAEITRRQVARQRSGGGGGGRSGNQDLSALFDRELMRQQETNYETRSSVESRNDTPESGALDKLRELARRQDEIAQQQRELMRARAALEQEELKRRLERLTREQEELRKETEALSQQLAQESQPQGQRQGGQQSGSPSGQQSGQQNAQGRQQSQSPSGSSGGSAGGSSDGNPREGQQARSEQSQQQNESDRLRDAAREMGDTARELSRANLDEAQARSDRTLERLRDLERRLSGEPVPDEERRMVGELQLEAQQIAEAQRRVARESRRLQSDMAARPGSTGQQSGAAQNGKAGGADGSATDALRRLAAEQERLAGRMGGLQRRLSPNDGAASGEGTDAATRARGNENQPADKATSAAHDEITRARLPEEMKKTASTMRDRGATPADDVARAGQVAVQTDKLAQAAGRVAERLGGSVAGSAETQRLTEQLQKLRGLRERMGEIEQRLRETAERAERDQQSAEGRQPGERQSANGARNPRGGQQSSNARSGQGGSGGAQDGNAAGARAASEIRQLEDEYDRALRETRTLMDAMGQQVSGADQLATPEQHEFSRSAPGTEAFKQDYSRWESLTRNVNQTLEDAEASLASRLSERVARDRVNAGADDQAPASYADSVARYYRSLARKPQLPPQQPQQQPQP